MARMAQVVKRRWFRFTLRTLFVLLFIAGVIIGPLREGYCVLVRWSLRAHAASRGVTFEAGSTVRYAPGETDAERRPTQLPPLGFWRRLFGDETVPVIVLPSECWNAPALTKPEIERLKWAFPEAQIMISL